MFAPRMTYARRQQYRYRVRGAGYALSAGLILLVAGSTSRSRQGALMVFALLLLGAALGWGPAVRSASPPAGVWVPIQSERSSVP